MLRYTFVFVKGKNLRGKKEMLLLNIKQCQRAPSSGQIQQKLNLTSVKKKKVKRKMIEIDFYRNLKERQ